MKEIYLNVTLTTAENGSEKHTIETNGTQKDIIKICLELMKSVKDSIEQEGKTPA